MIRQYIKAAASIMVLLLLFGCTNEPIQIQKQVKVTISPANVLAGFQPYDSQEQEMSDDADYGKAKLRITALLYDEDGKLVEKKEGLLNDYNSDYSCSFTTATDQKYTLLCFSSSIHGSLEDPDLESYEFTGIDYLANLKVSQWSEDSYYSNWSVLGSADVEISTESTEYHVDLRPSTAFVYMIFRNIHAKDDVGAPSEDCSGIYSASATDIFGETYSWDIEVEQYGSSVIINNLSPMLSSVGLTSTEGYQIYEGYIEDGYIIIPADQEVGYDQEGSQILMTGITRIEDETIYVGDIYIKVGAGTLTFETGFGTYLSDGSGWFDAFQSGVVFKSDIATGVDKYYIIYHNNDVVSYNQNTGFSFKTSLDAISNNGESVSPADNPSSKHIYSYANLLPGEFTLFARTIIGNDAADYSRQEVKIEAGKQYYIELNCENMNMSLIPGFFKSESWDLTNYSGYRKAIRKYVTSDTILGAQVKRIQL